VNDMESFETIGKKRFGSNNISSNGGFNETRDTVPYLTTLNGVGSLDMVNHYGSRDEAQLSYRHKLDWIGFVRDSIGKTHNTSDLGNTLIVSKGKISIPNTGKSEISQGMEISWDIPVQSLLDQKVYGLSKCASFEPKRIPLLTEPTTTTSITIDELTKELCNFRNTKAREEVRKFWRGIIQASIGPDFQFAASNITDYEADAQRLQNLRNAGTAVSVNRYTVEHLIRTKALATVDDEDLSYLSSIIDTNLTIAPSLYRPMQTQEQRNAALTYLSTPIVENMAVLNHGTNVDYYQNVCERGVYDILMAIMGAVRSGHDRRIGRAVTDSIPGNYYDIVL